MQKVMHMMELGHTDANQAWRRWTHLSEVKLYLVSYRFLHSTSQTLLPSALFGVSGSLFGVLSFAQFNCLFQRANSELKWFSFINISGTCLKGLAADSCVARNILAKNLCYLLKSKYFKFFKCKFCRLKFFAIFRVSQNWESVSE